MDWHVVKVSWASLTKGLDTAESCSRRRKQKFWDRRGSACFFQPDGERLRANGNGVQLEKGGGWESGNRGWGRDGGEGGHRGKIFHVYPAQEKKREKRGREPTMTHNCEKIKWKAGICLFFFLVGMMITRGMFWLLHKGVRGLWSGEASSGQQFPSRVRHEKTKGRSGAVKRRQFHRPPPVWGNLLRSYSNPLLAVIPQ